MTGPLANRCSASTRSGKPTLEGRPGPHLDFAHGKGIEAVPAAFFARVCDRRFEDLFHQPRGLARGQGQDVEGITRCTPANDIGDLPRLTRRRSHVFSNRFRFHGRPYNSMKGIASSGNVLTLRGLQDASTVLCPPALLPRLFGGSIG
jgi:hypothetical protein